MINNTITIIYLKTILKSDEEKFAENAGEIQSIGKNLIVAFSEKYNPESSSPAKNVILIKGKNVFGPCADGIKIQEANSSASPCVN